MGTTLDALNAGSLTYKYVVAIEGYSWLLTSAAPAAAVTAWAGTDWTQALGGLFVEMDCQGSAHPWEPFQRGGTCTLHVMNYDGNDTFGIDTHRKLAGAETLLDASADRNDTTLTVKDTSSFGASGEAFVGTECFAYSGTTSTTFTGCTRGKYSPIPNGAGGRWAGHHRQGLAANRVSLSPVVSAQPRVWIGKWVAVYIHRDLGGVLDVKAQAHLAYAGKIAEIRDTENGFVVVQLKHVMDTLAEAMLGRDQWTAKLLEGIYMKAGQRFTLTDYTSLPSTQKTATALTCVSGTPANANEFKEGYYTLGDMCNVMNTWFISERENSRIYGAYNIESPVSSNVGLRSKIYYQIPNAGTTTVHWTMTMPATLAFLFGFTETDKSQYAPVQSITLSARPGSVSNKQFILQSAVAPLRAILAHRDVSSNLLDFRMGVVDEVGTFIDQFAFLPEGYAPFGDLGLEWGVFSFNDANYMVAAKVGNELRYILPAWGFTLPGSSTASAPWTGSSLAQLTVSIEQTGDIIVKQVMALQTSIGTLLKSLFYGSGTPGFNHASFDSLGYGLGLNLPGSLLGSGFETSLDNLPGSAAKIIMVIDKPTLFRDLVGSDLVLRWAFARWRQGTLSFATWQVPAQAAGPLLSENTKARPAASQDDDRSVTSLNEEWRYDIVTIRYNKSAIAQDDYRSSLTFEDAPAVDDSGGEGRPVTVKARNTYGEFSKTGAGVEELAPHFLATLTLFSRPLRKQTLSIGPALYEQIAPGDIVTVSDSFARDPATGLRGIFVRPGMVLRVRYNRGGAQPGSPRGIAAQGEVDVMYSPDGARFANYSYAATVDETVSGGGFSSGYNSGTLTLRCKAHDNSETSEAVDASRFVNGDKIVIIERDPANAASPLSWSRTVTGTPVGNDIVINSALSSPAFDAAKKYRIIYDHYVALQTAQQQLAAQADDADALIENAAPPYQFVESLSATPFTAYDPTIPVELIPDAASGDGKPLDVGHEFALMQLAQVLEDFRTARHVPFMFDAAISTSGWSSPAAYQLVAFWPVHLTGEIFERRQIAVAPMFRSLTGASASVRVSLCQSPPQHSGDTFPTSPGDFDVVRPATYSEAVFTTTSTTMAIPSAQFLDASVKNANNKTVSLGVAWVWIEISEHAEARGLARFEEGARQ
jgi:hypothetical protein